MEDPQLAEFTCTISDLAPWVTVNQCVIIPNEENKFYSQIEFQAYVDKNYKLFHTVFTDGSKIREPPPSVAIAIYVPHVKRAICWKLRGEHSIISAELFGILQVCNL